jgi:alpha-aminoadipic semialdehyde synthase
LGVKEVPVNELFSRKIHLNFSHTHKAQPHNLATLKSVLDKKVHLMDYELMVADNGSRLVQFGLFAGYAGMIDGLHCLGQRLLGLGYATPFLHIGMTYSYPSLSHALNDVKLAADSIHKNGLPNAIGPFIFAVLGDGQVSKGALHIFNHLPFETLSVAEMQSLSNSRGFKNNQLYLCHAVPKDYIIHKQGRDFDFEEFKLKPQNFDSIFHNNIAPFAKFILNGIFWTSAQPRLLSCDQANQLKAANLLPLLTLADVSCDINVPSNDIGLF